MNENLDKEQNGTLYRSGVKMQSFHFNYILCTNITFYSLVSRAKKIEKKKRTKRRTENPKTFTNRALTFHIYATY